MRLGKKTLDKSFGVGYTYNITPNFKGITYGKKSTDG